MHRSVRRLAVLDDRRRHPVIIRRLPSRRAGVSYANLLMIFAGTTFVVVERPNPRSLGLRTAYFRHVEAPAT